MVTGLFLQRMNFIVILNDVTMWECGWHFEMRSKGLPGTTTTTSNNIKSTMYYVYSDVSSQIYTDIYK